MRSSDPQAGTIGLHLTDIVNRQYRRQLSEGKIIEAIFIDYCGDLFDRIARFKKSAGEDEALCEVFNHQHWVIELYDEQPSGMIANILVDFEKVDGEKVLELVNAYIYIGE